VPVTETFLVADSMTGQDAVKLGEAFGAAVGLDGVILTKLDGDSRGGAALSLRVATGQRIRFAGTGEKPQDLEVFQADRIASRILGMGDMLTLIERAERTIDKQEAAAVEKRLRAGQLSFDDFLAQIRQVRSMGSLEGMLDMLPGGAAMKKSVAGADTEKEVRRMEAIILSMTARERAHPELIDGARVTWARGRQATGSGAGGRGGRAAPGEGGGGGGGAGGRRHPIPKQGAAGGALPSSPAPEREAAPGAAGGVGEAPHPPGGEKL